MSPLLKSVEAAGMEGIIKKRSPFNVTPDDFFEETDKLRKAYAELINAKDPNRVILSPSVSYGMANVVKNIKLKEADNVIVLGEQFPSNYYPWQRLCSEKKTELRVVEAPMFLENRGQQWNEKILYSIDSHTKVVAISQVHWTDGTKFELEAIRQRTNEVGALLIIDGTQSVGALPFDVEKIKPDALICAGYKWLLGPYSIGLSYYGPYFDNGVPVEENWINRLNSEDFAGLVAYEGNYQPGALRYEVGEHSNFILVPMMLEAINQINAWGVENIQQYCKNLVTPYLQGLDRVHIEDPEYRASHLFGIRFPTGDMKQLKQALEEANISVSVRGDAIRVSPHVYNTSEEVEKLVSCIKATG